MAKVRCRFCKFEEQSKCSVKKGTTVKRNKKRSCLDYQIDEDKILDFLDRKQNSSKPKVTVRPDRWWSRKERRAERDRLARQEMDQYQTTATTADSKHPVTGDLSRFAQSTVEDSGNEK